ncbi:BTAD domain-containing putative transcriptional regulator [Phytohabitans rumicis]|uniref:BTAD domain-containing putative transcriptional regulator n=1 Tax=Phytohabitans rumicis TaxID=1076125 RepID=UPI0024840A2D|nr:BTAD domain-containing putative transcriptional regulator [Phytohabitans rumicis]
MSILAFLMINANDRIPTGELLRVAWGKTDVDETQLYKCVSKLRGLLATIGRGDDIVTHSGYGYELRVAPDDLDSLLFERLLREAEAAVGNGTDDEARLLREALALWRGPHPLDGIPGDFPPGLGDDLRRRRKRAVVRLAEIELGRGRYESVVADLQALTRNDPTDARLCQLLMFGLFRLGHATEALAAYDRYAAALEHEAAAPPDPRLRRLRYAVASNDERAATEHAGVNAPRRWPLPRQGAVPRQLPMDAADLVGRDRQVSEAGRLLRQGTAGAPPVVVLTGPGGIGKTALAVRVGHAVRQRYPDGQVYVELRGTGTEPAVTDEVLAQVLRAFGIVDVPESADERRGLYRTLLGDKRVLLVLDDARDEAQIRDLMPGNPGCGVLVTARHRLPDIAGAHHLPSLEPLAPPQAAELFRRIVRRSAVDPLTEPAATRTIVELCAGLPLAICVAAALRASDPDRSAAELAERLADEKLGALVYGDRSVARSIGAGFERLDEDAQLLFVGLGLVRVVDVGVWTAAAILAGRGADPVAALDRLAACGLLQPATVGRFRLHDLTRQYARARAERHILAAAERQALAERVYGALLTLCRRAHRATYGGDFEVVHGDTPDWLAPRALLADVDAAPSEWYERERQNIRAAVRHTADLGLAELCWDLAISTHEFYNVRAYLDEWHATHRCALDACRRVGNVRGEAAMTAILGQPALLASGRPGVAGPRELASAAAAFERCGDAHGQAIALRTLANALRRRGRFADAIQTFRRALELYEESGDTVGAWQSLRYIGQTHLDLGDNEEALRVLTAAAEIARPSGQPRLLAQTAYWLGRVHLARRDVSPAVAQFQYVFAAAGDADGIGRAYALHGLGDAARLAGDGELAARHLESALELARRGHDAVLEGRIHQSLAELHQANGRGREATQELDQAVSCFDSGNALFLQNQVLEALGSS